MVTNDPNERDDIGHVEDNGEIKSVKEKILFVSQELDVNRLTEITLTVKDLDDTQLLMLQRAHLRKLPIRWRIEWLQNQWNLEGELVAGDPWPQPALLPFEPSQQGEE